MVPHFSLMLCFYRDHMWLPQFCRVSNFREIEAPGCDTKAEETLNLDHPRWQSNQFCKVILLSHVLEVFFFYATFPPFHQYLWGG